MTTVVLTGGGKLGGTMEVLSRATRLSSSPAPIAL
jgi:hypothetical protein